MMPRIRSIKPSFFTSDNVAMLPPLVRLLFIGLWCLADRDGLLLDKPARIRAEVMPYDKLNVDAALNSLKEDGFICRYTVNGQALIHVSKFHLHQRPHHKEPASTFHACPMHNSTMTQGREGKGIDQERKGAEGKEPPPLRRDVDESLGVAMRAVEDLQGSLTKTVTDAVVAELDGGTSTEWVVAACEEAAVQNVRRWAYVNGVLKHWKDHGRGCECMKGGKNGRVKDSGSRAAVPSGRDPWLDV